MEPASVPMPSDHGPLPSSSKRKVLDYYERNERYFAPLFFLGGVIFDIFTIGRIDSWYNLIQQATYLAIISCLLIVEVLESKEVWTRPRWLQAPWAEKIWRYRDELTHFLFGSLLSSFAIFYFLSSSIIGSFTFFVIITALLVANEFPRFRKMGTIIRFTLLAMCIASYFFYVVPIWWGSVGAKQFLVAIAITGTLFYGLVRFLSSKIRDAAYLRQEIALPGAVTLSVLVLLYFLKAIPPVPLSLKDVGIYHQVERANGGYLLFHQRPKWKVWETGDQEFKARPGDVIFCFFRLFSPTGFSDQIKVRWLYRDSKSNWHASDAVPVAIAGGRAQGYRGFTFKKNFQPGSWQVRIETGDEREIGRIYLEVTHDSETGERIFLKEKSL